MSGVVGSTLDTPQPIETRNVSHCNFCKLELKESENKILLCCKNNEIHQTCSELLLRLPKELQQERLEHVCSTRSKSPKRSIKVKTTQKPVCTTSLLIWPFVTMILSYLYPIFHERILHGTWPVERSWYEILIETGAGLLMMLIVTSAYYLVRCCCPCFRGTNCCCCCTRVAYLLCGEVDEDSDEEL